MGWIRRLAATLRRSSATDVFDEEARFHLEQRIEDHTRDGMSPEDARRAAHRQFGSVTRARESHARGGYAPLARRRRAGFALRGETDAPQSGLRTHRHSDAGDWYRREHRALRRRQRTAAQAAAGPSPRELVLFNWLEGRQRMRSGMDGVRTTDEATGRSTSTSFSYPTFQRLRKANRTLTELFAFYPLQQMNIVADGSADVASGQFVSGNYFRGLGVGAARGRTLTDEDDRPGAPPVATITHRALEPALRPGSERRRQDRPHQQGGVHHRRRHARDVRRHPRRDAVAGFHAAVRRRTACSAAIAPISCARRSCGFT